MIFKYLTKSFYINLSIIFLIFFLDRASKLYVIYLDKKNLNSKLFSSEFLNIDLIWNEGIAFGLFSFNQNNLYNSLTFIIAIIIILILVMTFYNIGLKKYSLLIIFIFSPPGLKMIGTSFVRSITVDSNPISVSPPSSIISVCFNNFFPRSFKT